MRTLLVLAQQPGFAEAIRAAVDARRFRIVHSRELWEVEPALHQGAIDAVLLDCDLTSVQPIRLVETLHKRLPHVPIVIVAAAKQWEWEEEAYGHGVAYVLTKPLRPRMLSLLLDRLWPAPPARPGRTTSSRPALATAPSTPHSPTELLSVLRDFSAILSHSLQAEPLLKEFLLLLREILGVNRAAVFLRRAPGVLSEPAGAESARRLRAMCAIGLPPELLGQFDLSLDAGIGGYLFRTGRVLRREAPEVENDLEMQKEFELLSAQVAVPILDRENLVGVALFDGRVTGEPLANGELGLIFHLLEQLGMAIKNIWLHDQVLASHDMMTDILRHLQSACLVVGWDLSVLHANQAARSLFGRPEREGLPLEFSDLPQVVGSKVFEVLKSGGEVRHLKFTSGTGDKRQFRLAVAPFRKPQGSPPSAALVLVEDCTEEEKLHALEIEAANLRLVRTMAERLSHEVGNAIVPLSTHQQLFAERQNDPQFRESLRAALDAGVQRVSRLASQMLYLARDLPGRIETIPLQQLIQDAFKDAQRHQPDSKPILSYENGGSTPMLQGDRASLKHAFAEILLNALQANPGESRINVCSSTHADEQGVQWVRIEFQDAGPGFTPQTAQRAAQPFFTTRNVGLGLGLTVCRKIVEVHHGRLEIEPPGPRGKSTVRISLPLQAPASNPASENN